MESINSDRTPGLHPGVTPLPLHKPLSSRWRQSPRPPLWAESGHRYGPPAPKRCRILVYANSPITGEARCCQDR